MEHFERMFDHIANLRLGDVRDRQLADDFQQILERFDDLTAELAEVLVETRKRRWHLQLLVGVEVG